MFEKSLKGPSTHGMFALHTPLNKQPTSVKVTLGRFEWILKPWNEAPSLVRCTVYGTVYGKGKLSGKQRGSDAVGGAKLVRSVRIFPSLSPARRLD